DRLVRIPCLDEVIAAELLLRLCERPVGHQLLAFAHPHGGRGRGGVEGRPGDVVLALLNRGGEREVLADDRLPLFLTQALPGRLVVVDEKHVLHLMPPSWSLTS